MKSINSNKDFNNLVKSGKPYVLDFYADWCGPCQTLLPTVEKLADEFKNEVTIVKVNIDKQRALAEKFKVKSIPSIFFMTSNKVKESINGVASEHTLRKKIKALV
ncbi:MAG: thioredoxin 1 [Saprospiraceae bacterium]|jgi:thioredoxin